MAVVLGSLPGPRTAPPCGSSSLQLRCWSSGFHFYQLNLPDRTGARPVPRHKPLGGLRAVQKVCALWSLGSSCPSAVSDALRQQRCHWGCSSVAPAVWGVGCGRSEGVQQGPQPGKVGGRKSMNELHMGQDALKTRWSPPLHAELQEGHTRLAQPRQPEQQILTLKCQ